MVEFIKHLVYFLLQLILFQFDSLMELPSLPITHLLSHTVHLEPSNTNDIYLRMPSLLIPTCLSVALVVICLFKMFSGLTETGPPRVQASEQLVIFMVSFGKL